MTAWKKAAYISYPRLLCLIITLSLALDAAPIKAESSTLAPLKSSESRALLAEMGASMGGAQADSASAAADMERAIMEMKEWKASHEPEYNMQGESLFKTRLQEEALRIYNNYRLYTLPLNRRLDFIYTVFDDSHFPMVRPAVTALCHRLNLDMNSTFDPITPYNYHLMAKFFSKMEAERSLIDNKNIRFAVNELLVNFIEGEKRLKELQWLTGEIRRELQASGSGRLPMVAAIQDIHGGQRRASALIGFALGLDADIYARVNTPEDLQRELVEAGIDIGAMDARIAGLNDKYDRGHDPIGTFNLVSWLREKRKAKPIIGNHDFWRAMSVLGVHLIYDEEGLDYGSSDMRTHHIAYWSKDAFVHSGWGDIEIDRINESRFNREVDRVNLILRLYKLPELQEIDIISKRLEFDSQLKAVKAENAKIRTQNELHKDDPGYERVPERGLPNILAQTTAFLEEQIRLRNAEIEGLNEAYAMDINPISFSIVSLDNYAQDPDIIERTLWELKNFRLFYVDIFGNIHMHNVVPFDFKDKRIAVRYKGLEGLRALELMQEEVRAFFENLDTIPDSRAFRKKLWEELGDVFLIINEWYSDRTAYAKAASVKRFIEAGGPEGFGKDIMGFVTQQFSDRPVSFLMVMGHNERKKFDAPEIDLPYFYAYEKTGSGVVLIDYEMSEGYSQRGAVITFFKRDNEGRITGIRLWGFPEAGSETIEDMSFRDLNGLNEEQVSFVRKMADGPTFMRWIEGKSVLEMAHICDRLIRESQAMGRPDKERLFADIKEDLYRQMRGYISQTLHAGPHSAAAPFSPRGDNMVQQVLQAAA